MAFTVLDTMKRPLVPPVFVPAGHERPSARGTGRCDWTAGHRCRSWRHWSTFLRSLAEPSVVYTARSAKNRSVGSYLQLQ